MKHNIIISLLLLTGAAMAQPPGDSLLAVAQQHFNTIQQLCATPAAGLWNKDLAGPVLLVDPITRKAYANTPDKEDILTQTATIYTGVLPTSVNMANTATTWAGIKWTMMLLPLPADRYEAMKLMAHELYHRIQTDIGLSGGSPTNDHLDTKEGRIYLRLELEALKAAWQAPVNKRQQHLQQAILFRQWRYQQFPTAKTNEGSLELNEGLAEFTGTYVSNIAIKDTAYLPAQIDKADKLYPTFARSFAYLTGPLYGMLLTQRQPGWQLDFKATDNLPDKLIKAYRLKVLPVTQTSLLATAKQYNQPAIRQEEEARETRRLAKEKYYTEKLVNSPVLELPISKKMSFSFNPNTLFPLGAHGTVYPTLTMTDAWGRLVVTGDARMKDWRTLFVSLPAGTVMEGTTIKTTEWELTLADGWQLTPGARPGDYKLIPLQ